MSEPEHVKEILKRAMKDILVCPDCGANMILKNSKYGKFYRWLREQMGMTAEECHIGRFDKEQCKKVIEICTKMKPSDMLICTSKSSDSYLES